MSNFYLLRNLVSGRHHDSSSICIASQNFTIMLNLDTEIL